MVQKRPFGDEESYEVSSKHQRQLEYSNQLVSFLEFVPAEDTALQPNISGEGEGSFTKGDEKHASGFITELPICTEKDCKNSIPDCISNTSLDSSSISEENNGTEIPFHLLFSHDYCNPDRPRRTLVHSEEIYTSLLECPPRKLVPVGPDFQVDVPEWSDQGTKNVTDGSDGSEPSEPFTLFSQASELDLSGHNDDENKLAGICVIPMPDFGPSACNGDTVGYGRTDCCCGDSGSVRCVRQHIKEAREKLWRILGPERFLELGFSNMGEVVADKWSLEEQRLFHEVVFSNPASLGRNFWDHLSMVFPSRTKKDIVSYYFNVFMLRRRAEQNVCYPMNIDSDDDEWQGSDDSGDGDDDSVIESLVYCDDPGHYEIQEDDSHEYDDSVVAHAGFNNCEKIFVDCDDSVINAPETSSRKLLNNCSPVPTFQRGKLLWDDKGDHYVQDDSCTSSDAGTTPQLAHATANNSKYCLGSFNGMTGGGSHEFVLEPCDTKVWDMGYMTCPKNEVEFLPTCSMIEEVFGAGAWNYNTSDSKG